MVPFLSTSVQTALSQTVLSMCSLWMYGYVDILLYGLYLWEPPMRTCHMLRTSVTDQHNMWEVPMEGCHRYNPYNNISTYPCIHINHMNKASYENWYESRFFATYLQGFFLWVTFQNGRSLVLNVTRVTESLVSQYSNWNIWRWSLLVIVHISACTVAELPCSRTVSAATVTHILLQ
jgi:hypothetical protein